MQQSPPATWLTPEPHLYTNFNVSAAALQAFHEQERQIDDLERLDPAVEEAVQMPPPYPSFSVGSTGSLPPGLRPPLAPLVNLDPAQLVPEQTSRQQRKNQKRRSKRAQQEKDAGSAIPWQDRCRMKKLKTSHSHAAGMDFSVLDFPVTKDDGLTGAPRNIQRGDRPARTVQDFLKMGFSVIEWDGVLVAFAFPTLHR